MTGPETVTYECGHTGVVNFRGSSRDLKRLLWSCAHQLCDACAEKRRREQTQAAAAANSEAGLPALTGTEKQIAWAESIRKDAVDDLDAMWDACDPEDPAQAEYITRLESARNEILAHDDASWWIDCRGMTRSIARRIIQRLEKSAAKSGPPADNAQEIFVPEGVERSEDMVTLRVDKNQVRALFPKDEKYRTVVKSLGYRWEEGAWRHSIGAGCASAADVAAQTANALLTAGFTVQITDAETKSLIHTESWKPINPRVLDYSTKYNNWRITTENDPKMRKAALALPHAAERGGAIVVPRAYHDAVRDFAETYGFATTRIADGALDELATELVTAISPVQKTPDLPTADPLALRKNEALDDLIDAD